MARPFLFRTRYARLYSARPRNNICMSNDFLCHLAERFLIGNATQVALCGFTEVFAPWCCTGISPLPGTH